MRTKERALLTRHVAVLESDHNATFWDGNAGTWPTRSNAPAWGIWNIPEADLNVLGDVSGLDVLDIGCSFGDACVALAAQGAASATGYDLSRKRIKAARSAAKAAGVNCHFDVRDVAAGIPRAAASVDVVISHRGALSYANPRVVLPEIARVLRPGGLLAACVVSPIAVAGYWLEGRDYLTTERFDDGRTIEYALPFGEWVRLLRANGFQLEDVIELPCPRCPHPVEQIWKAFRVPENLGRNASRARRNLEEIKEF